MSVKLDASNFIIWKSQWQNILKATGLYSFVDGTGVAPPAKIRNSSDLEITNPDFLQWMVDDAHLMSCISGTLSSTIYPIVIHCGTSLETWSNIEKRFTTLSRSHVHQLKNRLTATTKGSNTMEGYLQQIKTLNDQLTLAGSQVDNEDLVLITLKGLPDEYRAFKTSIRTRSSPIPMEELCALLLSEAIHEETPVKSQSSSDVNVAFVASRGGYTHQGNRGFSYPNPNRGSRGGFRGNTRGGRYNQRRGGFRNGHNGNRSSYSGSSQGSTGYTHTSPNSQGSYGSSSGSVVCQICDKPGHTAYDCWHRLNMDYQPNSSNTSTTSHTKAFVASTPEQSNSSNWYVDSAASTHMTNNLSNLSIYEPYQRGEQVTVGNGTTLPIHNTGNGILPTPSHSFRLHNVLHVPGIASNLVSVHQLAKDNDCTVTFDDHSFVVQDKVHKQTLFQGQHTDGLYQMSPTPSSFGTPSCFTAQASSNIWHQRLGHPSPAKFHHLTSKFHLPVAQNKTRSSSSLCTHCCVAKSHRLPFTLSNTTVDQPLALIHSDVWGPFLPSTTGFKYYVVFVDDYSRFIWVYPLYAKSDVYSKFLEFKAFVEN